MMQAFHQILRILGSFFPPYLSVRYSRALLTPIRESFQMAAGGIFVAVVIGLIASIWVAAELPGGRLIYKALIGVRSIPDLTIAIFCVVIVGIGPSAGTLALAIFYGAAMGKVFSDLLRAADRRPVEALLSTGARRLQVAFCGLLPLRRSDLVAYGLYEFESAVRASVIVGAVGAGGIGTELIGTINALDYHRTTTLILLLVFVIAVIDLIARILRRRPKLLALALLGAGIALSSNRPAVFAWQHAARTFWNMLPPELPSTAVTRIPRLVWETVEVAFGGTFVAAITAIPLGLLASRNGGWRWLSSPVRRLLETLRAVPEVIWGLILITVIGIGPRAGLVAIALHATGSLGRLFAECFDNAPAAPVRSLAAAGAPRLAIAAFGVIPLTASAIAVHTLFRLEWNVRAATVLGIIGAGGIGEALFEAQQLFFYRQMTAYIALTVMLVLLIDYMSGVLRGRISGRAVQGELSIA